MWIRERGVAPRAWLFSGEGSLGLGVWLGSSSVSCDTTDACCSGLVCTHPQVLKVPDTNALQFPPYQCMHACRTHCTLQAFAAHPGFIVREGNRAFIYLIIPSLQVRTGTHAMTEVSDLCLQLKSVWCLEGADDCLQEVAAAIGVAGGVGTAAVPNRGVAARVAAGVSTRVAGAVGTPGGVVVGIGSTSSGTGKDCIGRLKRVFCAGALRERAKICPNALQHSTCHLVNC